MKPLEYMIAQKIKQAEPALDIQGLDRKVLQIACQDWTNYLKFAPKQDADARGDTEHVTRENKDEIDAFMTVWVGMWLKKWRQRVKLLVGNQTVQNTKETKSTVNPETQPAKLEYEQEMKEMIVATLVRNAEICGTEILSENILKIELRKADLKCCGHAEQELEILSNVLHRAREMAQGIGPMMYVKVDKQYYGQKVD